jgi:hypothetical protein
MGIFKDCDIRGVYGADLTEAEMGRIGGALAQLLQGRSIAVGGDFRTHTPQLKRALIEALLRGGVEVWDVGQLSTPQLYFSKRALGTWACAQVTASHNPPQYNGLKLMLGELPVLPEDVREVGRLAEAGAFPRGEGVLHEADTAPPLRGHAPRRPSRAASAAEARRGRRQRRHERDGSARARRDGPRGRTAVLPVRRPLSPTAGRIPRTKRI